MPQIKLFWNPVTKLQVQILFVERGWFQLADVLSLRNGHAKLHARSHAHMSPQFSTHMWHTNTHRDKVSKRSVKRENIDIISCKFFFSFHSTLTQSRMYNKLKLFTIHSIMQKQKKIGHNIKHAATASMYPSYQKGVVVHLIRSWTCPGLVSCVTWRVKILSCCSTVLCRSCGPLGKAGEGQVCWNSNTCTCTSFRRMHLHVHKYSLK
jgi:hypothetical protein